jgi:hypothetical protein
MVRFNRAIKLRAAQEEQAALAHLSREIQADIDARRAKSDFWLVARDAEFDRLLAVSGYDYNS